MPTEESETPDDAESEDLPESQRDFLDRALKDMLQKPDNLCSVAAEFVPKEIERLDFEKMKPVERQFFSVDWRGRQADVFFEVPYRGADPKTHMLVSILVEHQSSTNYRIPVRTLVYTALYWERELHLWEQLKTKPKPFRLTPVLPIVFYTNKQKWGSFKSLQELLGPPEAFHCFAPQWRPEYWQLADHPVEKLLDSPEAFMQTVAILHAQGETIETAQPLFLNIFNRLDSLLRSNRSRWKDMLKFLQSWVQTRRPVYEQPSWRKFAQELPTSKAIKEELATMELTIAQAIQREGEKIGEQKGIIKGIVKGTIETTQRLLLRSGTKRFGAPAPEIAKKIQANQNVELLSDLVENLMDYDSWQTIVAKL